MQPLSSQPCKLLLRDKPAIAPANSKFHPDSPRGEPGNRRQLNLGDSEKHPELTVDLSIRKASRIKMLEVLCT